MSITITKPCTGCNIVGSCKDSVTNIVTKLVLNDMLAAIAAECVAADEADKHLENFYAGML